MLVLSQGFVIALAAPGTYQDIMEILWTHKNQRPKFS